LIETLINNVLRKLNSCKSEIVVLGYDTYRTILCKSIVPTKTITSPGGEPVIVHVNRQEVIDFLKNKYNFVSKKDLESKVQKEWKS
jgi:hypothetical protein